MRRGGAAAAFVTAVLAAAALSFILPDHLKVAGGSGHQRRRARARPPGCTGRWDTTRSPGWSCWPPRRGRFSSPSARAAVTALASQISRDPAVGRVQSPFGRAGKGVFLSRNGRAALVLVHFKRVGEGAVGSAIDRIRKQLRSSALRLQYGGFDVGFVDDNRVVRKDLLLAELIAFPVLTLLLIVVFRGTAAALLPLVIGGLSVLGTFACLRLLSHVLDISVHALNLSAALGLGLAVNAGLFLVSRYREESAARGVTPEALRITMSRAGRAVFYTGMTVAGACAALVALPAAVHLLHGDRRRAHRAALRRGGADRGAPLLPLVAYRHAPAPPTRPWAQPGGTASPAG